MGDKDISVIIFLYRVPPNLKAVVYRYGIAEGSVSDWDFLYGYLSKTNVASEKRTILDALSYSSTPWVLNRYLINLIINLSI